VLKSINRGDVAKEISGEISRGKRGTASAMAESPHTEGVLWVGTDDGALWVSRVGGGEWTDVTKNLPALDSPRWISHIEASRAAAGTAYIVIDGHRSHDFRPHIWKTTDYGETFEDLSAGLPQVSTRVLREDPTRPEVLYVGCEIGVCLSVDGGASWARLKGNLPTVRVDDIVIHPRDKDLVVGTHGRSVWIADASAVQALTSKVMEGDLHLFPPKDTIAWRMNTGTGRYGARRFKAPTPAGATISYWIGRNLEDGEEVSVEVHDAAGTRIAQLRDPGAALGLNEVTWNLRASAGGSERGRGRAANRGGRGGRGRRGGRGGGGSAAKPGTYRVTVKVGDVEKSASLRVVQDPLLEGAGANRP